MSEHLRCPKDNQVLWPSAFEKGWYLCPLCDQEYSTVRTGNLEEVDSRWSADV